MSELLVLGLNHRTAPVEIRERLAFSRDELVESCRKLLKLPYVEEALILSTCNRTELIVFLTDPEQGREILISFLAEEKQISRSEFEDCLYSYPSLDAVFHVFRVICGLDSMVLGEPQITGQLKEAYELSFRAGACKRMLNPLMQQALKTVKIIRNETGISDNSVSVSYAAVELAKKILGDLDQRNGLLVGAGEMSELSLLHLKKHGIKTINVTNRTYSKAVKLAQKFAGKPFPFDELPQALQQSDVVISSTGSSEPIIETSLVKEIMRKRKYRPMFFIDIAVPRDIEEAVSSIPEVYLYDIDDLKNVVEANIQKRKMEAQRAEKIINQQVCQFQAWRKIQELNPVIRSLKDKAETIRRAELDKSLRRLKHMGPEERNELERLSSAIVNKLLHEPITALKKFSLDDTKKKKYVKVMKDFFNLE
ncbi:MAG: glutamyl-tRNA reductase [Candidatus Aminicenantales bacterium]